MDEEVADDATGRRCYLKKEEDPACFLLLDPPDFPHLSCVHDLERDKHFLDHRSLLAHGNLHFCWSKLSHHCELLVEASKELCVVPRWESQTKDILRLCYFIQFTIVICTAYIRHGREWLSRESVEERKQRNDEEYRWYCHFSDALRRAHPKRINYLRSV